MNRLYTILNLSVRRSVTLDYLEDINKGGVEFNRYAGTRRMFAHPSNNSDNWCFCPNNQCPPADGVVDSSVCRYGTPAFVSFPHFYAADDYYINKFAKGSLNPDQDKHEFRIDLNPRMSVPLAVRARFQINMMVKPIEGISLMNMEEIYIPVLWFGVNADLTDSLLTAVWWGVNSPWVAAVCVGVVGAINIVLAITFGQRLRKSYRSEKTV